MENNSEFEGGWFNFRIVEKKNSWKSNVTNHDYYQIFFEIHEVYYNSKGNIIAWTENPYTLYFDNHKDVKYIIKHIKDAYKKTVLKIENDKLIDTGKKLNQYKDIDLCNYDASFEYDKFKETNQED